MTIAIQMPRIRLEETPREIIADYCVSEVNYLSMVDGDIPRKMLSLLIRKIQLF